MQSLRIKLMFIIVAVTVAILIAVSYTNYYQSSKVLKNELSNAAANSAEHNAMLINQWVQGIVNEAVALAQTSDVQSLDTEKYLPALKRVFEKHDDYSLIYVADQDGKSMGTSDKYFNVSTRAYFMDAMEGKTVISDPVMGKSTGKLVVVIATPIYQKNQESPTGIVGISVTLDYLQKLVADMKLSGYGYGFIQHSDMTTIAHINEEYLGNKKILEIGNDKLNQILDKMSTGEKGHDNYSLDGVDKLLAYAPVKLTGWSIAQTANINDIMSPLDTIRNTSLFVTAIAILIIMLIALLIANFISKPIINLSRIADAVSHGDLATKKDFSFNSKDEIGVLSSALMGMVDNLRSIISNIQKKSEQLSYHSQELASTSEEVSATVEEVASTTNEVAATSNSGAENAKEAAKESEDVLQVAEEGNQAVQETVIKINSIATSTENVSIAIQKLGEQSNRIGEIISSITNIADQTNLLALNAAIEAARAGEHGRGFAVVAEEVRKLAEQSAGAANEITNLIKEIQVGVGEAINAMETGAREVNEGVQIANNAGASIAQIIEAINKNTSLIKEVADGAMQVDEGTQQLTTANEQIASTVQQVSSAAQELANISAELQQTVAKFKIDEKAAL